MTLSLYVQDFDLTPDLGRFKVTQVRNSGNIDPREIALGPCSEEEVLIQRDYWTPRLEAGIYENQVKDKI